MAMEDTMFGVSGIVPADWTADNSMIKVIGVGGGGNNAVSYMFEQQIEGCSFYVCNTDSQSLKRSPVPNKIQLGAGLGAGTNPAKGRNAAMEAAEIISEKLFTPGTQMLFITACMGGGTGTGASPVIAKMAKDKGILTVAVVTLPSKDEGGEVLSKAIDGIHDLESNVDSLLIINNEKLLKYYGKELIQDTFPKADQVLATAVQGIIEIITKPGYINVDFEDVNTMMRGSGMALMGYGEARGENRIEEGIKQALESPLLNDFDLQTAKNALINITVGKNEQGIRSEELIKITEQITSYIGDVVKYKRGIIYNEDPDFGDKFCITVIATGFKMNLIGLAGSDIGKRILISSDYEYTDKSEVEPGDEVSLPIIEPNIIKVGMTTNLNRPKFYYPEDQKPVLATEPEESISELEATPAINRKLVGKA